MSDKLLKAAVTTRNRLLGWRNTTMEAVRRRGDEGQSAVEYMGIIVVVVAIIIVLLNTNFGDTISGEITEQIEQITSR
ncbi:MULTISPECIES: hypothetical protein [Streptomyces]|uniref:Flp family type IVb pilin n=1 Tax=Streptomyces desertarenae TaxID=2666184 RepID=A0ABW4PSF7_9ACTN